jgi:hypothetical protein
MSMRAILQGGLEKFKKKETEHDMDKVVEKMPKKMDKPKMRKMQKGCK